MLNDSLKRESNWWKVVFLYILKYICLYVYIYGSHTPPVTAQYISAQATILSVTCHGAAKPTISPTCSAGVIISFLLPPHRPQMFIFSTIKFLQLPIRFEYRTMMHQFLSTLSHICSYMFNERADEVLQIPTSSFSSFISHDFTIILFSKWTLKTLSEVNVLCKCYIILKGSCFQRVKCEKYWLRWMFIM
jgi:hypothetical protein